MSILSKALRISGLLVLLLAGFAIILAAHIAYISDKVPVSLLGDGRVSVGGWDGGFVAASGTWTIEGDGHAFPLNVSEIHCVRDEERCYGAEARLSDRYLSAELERYAIRKWDNSTLEFVTEAQCVTYVYVINRSTERLTGRRLKKKPPPEICQGRELENDLKLSFVGGSSIVRNLQQQHAPTPPPLSPLPVRLA
jgi:hypothetical protein